MKFFPVNAELDNKIEKLLVQIRHLKDGETAEIIERSGAQYHLNYGISLVHLRKMAADLQKDSALAVRLWHRQIRETMIIATMAADFATLGEDELNEWGEMMNTIELAEQMGHNLLVNIAVPENILLSWLKSGHFYKQYAAIMGIGWRMRLNQEGGFNDFPKVMDVFENLAHEPRYLQAVGFALKIAGRFSSVFHHFIVEYIDHWSKSENVFVRQAAEDVRFELDAFL
jgi:hypothetical protein